MDEPQSPTPNEPEYFEFEDKWQQAINFLQNEQRGIAIAALNHSRIGKIDLVWDAFKIERSSSGYGLAKIVQKHPEVLINMQPILLKMKATFLNNEHGWRLQGYGYKANVRMIYNGQPRI